MPEIPNPQTFEYLKDRYTEANPDFWTIRFVDSILFEDVEVKQGEKKPYSSDFSFYLYDEAAQLALDHAVDVTPDQHSSTVKSLIERERVHSLDKHKFHEISPSEYELLMSLMKFSAGEKLVTLSQYLTHLGLLYAVPLSFLAGHAIDIFDENFVDKNSGDSRVFRKAERLYSNGGRIIIPTKDSKKYLSGFFGPLEEGFATVAFGPIPQNLEMKIKRSEDDDYIKILAMMQPTVIGYADEE